MFEVQSWLVMEEGDALERATFADLSIVLDGVCLTEVLESASSSLRRSVRLPLAPLAEWLLWNHWRLRYEPRQPNDPQWALSHSLSTIGGGYLWPRLTLAGDGERVVVEATPTQARRGAAPMIRYLTGYAGSLAYGELDHIVASLVERVVARANAVSGADVGRIVRLAASVREETRDAAVSALRTQEALLGLEPDEQPPEVLNQLRRAAAWLGPLAADELFASARFGGFTKLNDQLHDDDKRPNVRLKLQALLQLVGPGTEGPYSAPWQRGVDLAARVRTALGAGVAPINLDELVDAPLDRGDAPRRPNLAGFWQPDGEVHAVLGGHPTTRRFTAARLIGDGLCLPAGERVSPVVEGSRARQQVQRAFAQELLAPIAGIAERVSLPAPSESEIEDAAAYYGVSPYLVQTALVNRSLADRDLLPV